MCEDLLQTLVGYTRLAGLSASAVCSELVGVICFRGSSEPRNDTEMTCCALGEVEHKPPMIYTVEFLDKNPSFDRCEGPSLSTRPKAFD